MEVTEEDENLFRARKVIEDELLPSLREYFKQTWNGQKQQGTPAWSDSPDDGKALQLKLKSQWRNLDKNVKKNIQSGKTMEWDATCLFTAILALDLGKEEHIFHKLKKMRNELFHKPHGGLSSSEKDTVFTTIKNVYRKFSWSLDGVNNVEKASITTEELKKLKTQLESEKRKALKENQEDLCKLRKKLNVFVGRTTEMKELKEKLSKGDTFLIITGGPCYGKSSLASQLGHAMYDENEYNYVIWINMRDIPNPPQLKDVADKILREFDIDTTEMKGDTVEILKRKFELITTSRKRALLIFDNADDLIAPPIDKSCKSSTFSELSRHIRGNSRETIRAVFTTRIYSNTASEEDHYTVKLEHLSNKESEEYLQQELEKKNGLDKEQMVKDVADACNGLPFALRLVCSYVNQLPSMEMIEDYVNDLKKDPLKTVGEDGMQHDDVHLFACLDLSLQRFDESDLELLSLLAVFPSRFSYAYVKKLLSFVGKDGAINPRELLIKLEKHSLLQDDSYVDVMNQDGKYYVLHSFLCQYIKKKYWDDDKEHYHKAYYKLYTNELFMLGRKSLEKDNYKNCWEEFEMEQHNFLYVMAQIGDSCDKGDYPSYIVEVIRELSTRETPDFIAMYLLCIDLTNPCLLHKFIKVCEDLAQDKQKKKIWCCRYDLSEKYFDGGIEDPCKEVDPDDYGKALLNKRRISNKLFASLENERMGNFTQIMDELQEFKNSVDNLECVTLKNFFKVHILLLKGCLLRKCLNVKKLSVTETDCIKVYNDALDICNEHFGQSLVAFDCYNERKKLFLQLEDVDKIAAEFRKLNELLEDMPFRRTKEHGSFLLGKAKPLMFRGIEERKADLQADNDVLLAIGCKDLSSTRSFILLLVLQVITLVMHRLNTLSFEPIHWLWLAFMSFMIGMLVLLYCKLRLHIMSLRGENIRPRRK